MKHSEVYVKVTRVRNETIVAICDKELLGKKFKDETRDFTFEVKETFFKGEKMSVDNSLIYLKEASIANLVGAKIVEKAVKEKLIHQTAVIEIAGILHAQLIRMC